MKTIKSFMLLAFVTIFFSISCTAEDYGKISFATTDENENIGVWTHSYTAQPPQVEYVRSRTGTETVFIKGYMKKENRENYHKDYYFEYILPNNEIFDISLLSSFDIITKDVCLARYAETEMLFRFYIDDTDNFCEISSRAGYNETHSFTNCTDCIGNVTKIRFWPVYEVYDKNGNIVSNPEMHTSVNGVLNGCTEMNVYFSFGALTDNLPTISLPVTSVSGSKLYTGTGLLDGASKYKVILSKERYESPKIAFETDGDSYRPYVINPISGATYSYSIDGGEYADAVNNIFPSVSASAVISVKAKESEFKSESLLTVTTPFGNALAMSMMLDGSINFKLYLVTSLQDGEYEVLLDKNSAEVYTDENGKYIVCSVAPKDFTDKSFSVTFTAEGFELERVFNAVDCANMYASCSPALSEMISALKEYAATAKEYFLGIPSSVSADSAWDEEILTCNIAEVWNNGVESISIYSSSLVLDDKITIRHYFKTNESFEPENYTVTCDGKALDLSEKDGYYYVDIENICVSEICDEFVVCISEKGSENALGVKYSVASYIAECIFDTDNESLVNLLKSLYAYYKACITYINT